jgi:hypothetical protein
MTMRLHGFMAEITHIIPGEFAASPTTTTSNRHCCQLQNVAWRCIFTHTHTHTRTLCTTDIMTGTESTQSMLQPSDFSIHDFQN